ncbi:MAG: diguanylate cyclase [Xanthomonadales bacterium]|nr:diguanylate cyclase [Xanthomonadales bacterium]
MPRGSFLLTCLRPLVSLVFLAFCSGLAAAEPALRPIDVTDESAPTFTVYSSREGLSDEIWSTVGWDKQGFVWAGSASGLARFDGYRWTPWPFAQAHSLVRDMQVDARGNLWAIFEREGLARHDGRAWSLDSSRNAFHQRFSDTFLADGTPQFWVSEDHGFRSLVGDRWQEDPGNDSVRSGPLVRIEQSETLFGQPRQWMGTGSDGLWYRTLADHGKTNPWQRFEQPGFATLHTTDLLRTHDGDAEELWVLTYGDGLIRIRNDGIRRWRAVRGELPTESIYSARATYSARGQRTLWLASRAGLLRFRNDRFATFDRRNGLPADAVRGIKLQRNADATEVLWLATEGGIARTALTNSQWQTVSLLGARENGIFAVMLEADGKGGERLWVGSAKEGLALLQDGEWRHFTLANGLLPHEGVRQVWRLADGAGGTQRLVSLINGELLRIDDALDFSPVASPWPKNTDELAAFALSRGQGSAAETWFGTLHSGAYRLLQGQWTQYLADGASQPWAVINMTEQIDAHGRSWLWAASNQGLALFNGLQWKLIPGLPADSFRDVILLKHAPRPTLWAASNRKGILRLDVGNPEQPVLLDDNGIPPPPDPTIYTVTEDSQGRIYVCTNNGVQQLTPAPDGHYDERVFRRRDGLVHDECNTNAQFVDAHDRYWVGTLGGLSMYDPNVATRAQHAQPNPLRFTELRVDGELLDASADAPRILPAGTREIDVGFAVLSGFREQESTYRSQLVGLEPAASAWSTEHHRHFSRIPPGHYRLQVEGRDYAGIVSAPIALEFSIQAHWFEQTWIRILLGLAALALALGLVMLYNHGLHRRQRHLKLEVARRTSEIRAANQRLTELSYQDPLTGVANRRRLMEAVNTAIERARARGLPIGLIVIDVDHFKDYNDRHGHLAGDVALRAIAQALQSATREQDLVSRFGGEEFACLMIDAGIEAVERCAERMRALVEALPPRTLGNDTQTITISAGIMSRVPGAEEDGADLLREADTALYRAKAEGRNRICRVRPGGIAGDALPG